jgi:hypothetical protein
MAWPQSSKTTANLNFRSGPSISSSVLGVFPSGTLVTITGPANSDGWYPVSSGGLSGWSKASYFEPLPATPPPPPSTPPPGGLGSNGGNGGMEGNSSSGAGTPFYNPSSKYGAAKSLYDTDLVKKSADFNAERTVWATKAGMGGLSGKSQAVESQLFPKVSAGYAAAKLNNPGLLSRDYFTGLGSNFIENALRRMTPGQRNENYATKNALVRSTPR